jgi:hypothetical protein
MSEETAEQNVQSDWNETDTESDAFILNKPVIPAGGTDDQNISGSGLNGNTLTIGIEDGNNEDVDLSSIADQTVSNTGDSDIQITGTYPNFTFSFINGSGFLSAITGTQLDNIWTSNGILTRTGTNTYSYVTDNSSNWNTAYGWGDHAIAGYLTSSFAGSSSIVTVGTLSSGSIPYSLLSGTPTIIDWTQASQGTIHASNYVDSDTQYTPGIGLDLEGNEFRANFGDEANTIAAGNHNHSGVYLESEVDGSTTNEIEVVDEAFNATNFDGDTASAVSQDDFYDRFHLFDTDDDGDLTDESWWTTIINTFITSTGVTKENLDTNEDVVDVAATLASNDTDDKLVTAGAIIDYAQPLDVDLTDLADRSTTEAYSFGTLSGTDPVYNFATTADNTVTLAMVKKGVLTDKDLPGSADFLLPNTDTELTAEIFITDGTYTISLVPPTDEALWEESLLGFISANYEMDLSSTEGNVFILKRRYSGTASDYRWFVYPAGGGTVTDGGAGD